MKPEVSCANTSGLVSYIRRTRGQDGVVQLLNGINGIDEDYLMDTNNWISLEVLFQLFDNIQVMFDDLSPKLFYDLGKELTATQEGALVNIIKWVGNTSSIIKRAPMFNRRFNVDQEMEVISVNRDNALIINYFPPGFYEKERKHQCEWNKGVLAGIPMLWGLPAAEVHEIVCSFRLEDILRQDYSHLGLSVEFKDGVLRINGTEYAHRVALTEVHCDKALFRHVRKTPPGIERGRTSVFTGGYDEVSEGADGFSGILVTKTLSMGGEVIREGEIYNAPYCLYQIRWKNLPFFRKLYNMTFERLKLYFESKRELEKLLILAEQRLFEAEQAKNELAELNRKLEEMVEQRTARLIEAEKLAAVGRLSFGVGHDLRNTLATAINSGIPLRRLMADLQQIMGMLEDGNPTEKTAAYMSRRKIPSRLANAPELYETMMSSLAQALDNVKALEGYAVQDGTDFQDVSIEDVIQRVLHDYQEELQGIQVETSFEEGEYVFMGNPLKLYDIFQNLVSNAIEAMEEEAEPILRVTTQISEGVHVTTVEDNGCGMSEEVRRHAFEPFYTTRGLAEGRQRGLGLFNVWRLVEQHSGTIEIESEPGEYTRFHVYLKTAT